MLSNFYQLQSTFKVSSNLRLNRYGFVIYFPTKLLLKELTNIKSVIKILGGNLFFFNSRLFNFSQSYLNCLFITFSDLASSLNFPYYLDTVFTNFNYFPLYFKFNTNLLPLNNNFLFDRIVSLVGEDMSAKNISLTLILQKRRIFILFKFFFNSLFILKNKKLCQL
jgi:hypothetical protein